MVGCLVATIVLSTGQLASGKEIAFAIEAVPATVSPGAPVRIIVQARSDLPGQPTPDCVHMRILAVAPSVGVRDALHAVERDVTARRTGQWRAFRLASLRRVDHDTWVAGFRPNVAGVWTLVIPNWCAFGYAFPDGAFRQPLVVSRLERGYPYGFPTLL